MIANLLKESLECVPIEKIGARMQLERDCDAEFAREIENRTPATGQLAKRFVDQAGRPLGPGIREMPRESARQHWHAIRAELRRGAHSRRKLPRRPTDACAVIESKRIERL